MKDIIFEGSLLSESTGKTNRYPVKVIQPGWGSSGYYSESVLAAAASLFENAQMFWNHPKSSDNYERPERDLRDLAGVLTNVRYEESNPAGAGVYGDAIVFEPFRETLNEIAPYIGVSIRAGGKVKEGEAEGRSGLLVEEINLVQSVDFVTRAGAGGKVLAQFAEAARAPYPDNPTKEENMELAEAMKTIGERDEQIKQLNATIQESKNATDALRVELARMQEAALLTECAAVVAQELKESGLPEITRQRIQQEASKFMKTKDGDEEDPASGDEKKKKKKLDTDKVKESVQEAIKAEKDYISKLTGGIHVRGLGESAGDNGSSAGADADNALASAFQAMGLSESAAKIAANGR